MQTNFSLAQLADENPDWAFPTVQPGISQLIAQGLGHPLLTYV